MDRFRPSRRQPDPSAGSPREDTLNLLDRARAGDDAALEELCARFRPSLFNWATGRLPRKARGLIDTGDLVQDTLVGAIRRIDGLRDQSPSAFTAYLRSAILNRIRDELRRAAVRPEFDTLDESEADSSPSPLEQTIGLDHTEQYERALARLKEDDQAAIFLRIELDMSYADLADALGRPSPNAARMAVSRALVRLAEVIHDENGQG